MTSPRPFRLAVGPGAFVVGDELPGARPCYLFLHGLGSVRQGEKSTLLLMHAAAQGRSCLRFDMRGHGESSGQLGHVAVSELIADAIRVLEHTGPADVIGSSLGGLIAAHAAAQRPDLVRRMALLAPAFGLMADIERHLDADGRMVTSTGLQFHVTPQVLADARRLDERGLPARIATPTLVVHGTDDDVIPPAVSVWFFSALTHPHKELWLVPGGDHRLTTVAGEIWQRLDDLGRL